MTDLTKIGDKYGTDKSCLNGNGQMFTDFYNFNFEKIRYNKLNILEIGVFNGSSINMWSEYFPNSNVYGLDIDLSRSKNTVFNENTQIFLCDATNESNINEFLDNINNVKFDIIIDDGSHQFKDQLKTLLIFMNHINKDGLYIIEDLHTSIKRFGEQNDSPLNFLCFNNKPSYISKEEYELLNDRIDSIKLLVNFKNKNAFDNRLITSIIKFKNEL